VRAYTRAWNCGAGDVYGNPAAGLRARGPERAVTVAGGAGSGAGP
jgi:hypothetical protein